MSEVRIAVEQRTEFGKGAARRTRRAGKIPAVLYGHGSDPKHLSLPTVEFARAIRENGHNAVLTLDVAGGDSELALTKTITSHPIKGYIEHVDLLLVKRGEKVTVAVPVVLSGEAGPGSLVSQETTEVEVEAEALHIPEQLELSIAGAEVGTQLHASDIQLPSGVTLQSDPETLVVNITEAAAAMAEEPAAEEAAEGEAAEA
ncbi:50S ribosomal protein L25/general stress protein Ctc [Saccharopolyspora hirsuta]|uniref:Large ribosomal subunit protein bL25 n=1 Tax=Saccharopolyspora hirsuta TaxID=1837 RepID=A0A5M7C4N6_SACHI|nr:50S ribosomal protein L25/general stress protein Ctc [Saccharopolyspora hirsuta]KAA5836972.1 50S ribosomal protein L25/general stress protein Ctc [Saccharopolyspora hirsuta]